MFTKLYLQFKCEMDEDNTADAMRSGYIIFLCSFIIAVVYKIALAYLDFTTNHNFLNWDAKTCTPADYTIELKISESMMAKFNRCDGNNTLDEHVRKIITNEVKNLEPVSPDAKKDDVEIATISYGYHNQNMIKLLQKRGKFIA